MGEGWYNATDSSSLGLLLWVLPLSLSIHLLWNTAPRLSVSLPSVTGVS